MENRFHEPKDRLIVAMDLSDPDEIWEKVLMLSPHVGCFKFGFEAYTSFGPKNISLISKNFPNKLFIDLKLLDIPNTVKRAAANISRLGADYTTIHHSAGGEAIKGAVEAAPGTNILVVTKLTSDPDSSSVESKAADAKLLGAAGCICSAREARIVRACTSSDFLIVTPGIRFKDESNDDQSRVVDPISAFCDFAVDMIVVGRPILQAADPVVAANKFVGAIREGLKERKI